MRPEEPSLLNQCYAEAVEKYDELLELACEVSSKKALSNLRQLNKSLVKLNEYSTQFPLTFKNQTICLIFRKMLKVFPLIIYDIGPDCPRKLMKWYSQWCGRVFVLMSLEIDPRSPISNRLKA